MMKSLFLFDMTFWLYLAALVLYIGYLFARRPTMALAPAGHLPENFDERDGVWATQLGQVATLVTIFGWMLTATGVTPGMRDACPTVAGRWRESFWRISWERPWIAA